MGLGIVDEKVITITGSCYNLIVENAMFLIKYLIYYIREIGRNLNKIVVFTDIVVSMEFFWKY